MAGTVDSLHQGLNWTGVRVKVGRGAFLRVRWPSHETRGVRIGQQVLAKIAVDAVLLGLPGRPPGKDRFNRWNGRIVLVQVGDPEGMITVKVHGENWTLKSIKPVSELDRRPQVWDEVSIVVDPIEVRLVCQDNPQGSYPMSFSPQSH